jgi:hypothetical protein
MSRHQSERNRRSIAAGGLTGDADDNAGLGLANAMDAQRTESALNDAGVTDSLGMSAVDKLGTAVAHGAMLSDTENQQRRGIVAGYNSQFSANRISDVTGLPGVVTDTAASMFGRPPGTMERDVNIGRARANDKEMGGLMQTGLGIGMSELGISAPMNAVNFGQAVARSATDTNMNSLRTGTHQSRYGSRPSRQGQTGTVSAARDAMASGRPGAAPKARGFEFSPVNMGSYKRGLMRNYMK